MVELHGPVTGYCGYYISNCTFILQVYYFSGRKQDKKYYQSRWILLKYMNILISSELFIKRLKGVDRWWK
jgi:hypothetical protein